jgi:simple sugar transport system permease protein
MGKVDAMNVESLLTALLSAAILGSVPPMLAAVGESISERAGLLNLGIEGTMLAGAFVAFWTTLETDSHVAGLGAGVAVGAAIGITFGLLATIAQADQVVLGLGLTLAGAGGTAFAFRELYGSTQPLLSGGLGRPFSGFADWLPVLGPALLGQRWFVYAAWLLVLALHLLLTRSRLGLRIRAAGESPLGLEAVGGSVWRVRVYAAVVGGAMSGLAGASLSIVELGFFTPGMTGGIGFIAIALAMLGRLSPIRVSLVALAFGLLTGLDTGLQVAGVDVRPELLQMIPYIGMVVALLLFGRGARLPASLGQPWRGIGGEGRAPGGSGVR